MDVWIGMKSHWSHETKDLCVDKQVCSLDSEIISLIYTPAWQINSKSYWQVLIAELSGQRGPRLTTSVWQCPALTAGHAWLLSFPCISQSRKFARMLVENGHKGRVLSRKEFEEGKAAAQAAEAAKSNTFYNRSRPVWVNLSHQPPYSARCCLHD